MLRRLGSSRLGPAAAFVLVLAAIVSTLALLPRCSSEGDPSPRSKGFSEELRSAVTPEGVLGHAERFQEIAERNGGNRAAGTPGYDASADYVAGELRAAGYEVTIQRFEFSAPPAARGAELARPDGSDTPAYDLLSDFAPMEGSAVGRVGAPVRPVDAGSPTSGCEAADFAGFPEGAVALVRRGTCTFRTKAGNAEEAGAAAALIFNAGEPSGEVLFGSLDSPPSGAPAIDIPVLGTSARVGAELLAATGATVRVSVEEEAGSTTTNVLAETPGGDPDNTVMVGAHLDSVARGPGINDNASGSSTVLEIALRMAELDAEPRNRVRFAFWGAEEVGLVGSRHYVEGLEEGEVSSISAYLNFDMVGSRNFVRTIYEGPDEVEDVFEDYFQDQGVRAEVSPALDGRSDHGPFQDEGIPTGGLFTGAGGSKTGEQADAFGGNAGAPFDACYHEPCDDLDNLDEQVIDELSDGAAHATAVLAERPRD